jgi:hypothetical protein
MRSVFSDEDIELMLAIRREEEARAAKKARRSSQPKRVAKSQLSDPMSGSSPSSEDSKTKLGAG